MLHALYIIAFAILAVLAISNLIRNLMLFGAEASKKPRKPFVGSNPSDSTDRSTPHPEMLDERGRVVDEPLLVMRSISIEDAREQLDALYEGSAGQSDEGADED